MWLKSMGAILATGFIAIISTCPADAQNTARMDEVMRWEANGDRFMGAILVAKGDSILFDRAYGSANLELNVPNTPTTRFRINSLAKQFTAAAILLLEERGKLKLSDPVAKYWPQAPASWRRVTVLDLLRQSSGIPDFTDVADFGSTMKLPQTPEQRIATIKDKPLATPPGEKFEYSNSNYLLLGVIVAAASGTTYAQFVHDNIFAPLGMNDTGFDTNAIVAGRAAGYAKRVDQIFNATFIDPSAQHGAGGIYSTTHDLLTWQKGLLGGKLLNRTSLSKMMTPYFDARGPGAPFNGGYGLGVYVGTTEDGRREISHTGSGPGFVSMMAAYPDDRVYIILLGNIDSTPYGDIVSKMSSLALGKDVVLPDERKPIVIAPAVLSRYAGRYQLTPSFVVDIVQKDGMLEARIGKNPPITLFAQAQSSFFARSPDVQADFHLDRGRVSSLTWRIGGDVFEAPNLAN